MSTVSVNASEEILLETHDVEAVVNLVVRGEELILSLETVSNTIQISITLIWSDEDKSKKTNTSLSFWSNWRASNCVPSGADPAMTNNTEQQQQ